MVRVYTLYRVSTLGQVDHNDIPMQRTACQDFVATQDDWQIVKEFYEKGVSGYKVKTDKRDAIVEIKADAEAGKFDVLLVFMFDRLGRREMRRVEHIEACHNSGENAEQGDENEGTDADQTACAVALLRGEIFLPLPRGNAAGNAGEGLFRIGADAYGRGRAEHGNNAPAHCGGEPCAYGDKEGLKPLPHALAGVDLPARSGARIVHLGRFDDEEHADERRERPEKYSVCRSHFSRVIVHFHPPICFIIQ